MTADSANEQDQEPGVEAETETETNVEADVETEANVEADVETEANVEADIETEANVEADIETEANVEVEAEPKLDAPAVGTRQLEAEAVVHRNVLWAFSAGVLPVPLFDVVAITGVQLKLLKELSEVYGLTFREGMAKKAVASLLVGIGGVGIGGAIGASLFKFVPVVGYALGVASIPVIAGALTHAVGKAFIMHFEAGGTLLDFDPQAMRDYFEAEFTKAKQNVAKFETERGRA